LSRLISWFHVFAQIPTCVPLRPGGDIVALAAGSSAAPTPTAPPPRPELLVSLSLDGTAILWNWRTQERLVTYAAGANPLTGQSYHCIWLNGPTCCTRCIQSTHSLEAYACLGRLVSRIASADCVAHSLRLVSAIAPIK
jgi:hypothetical protein